MIRIEVIEAPGMIPAMVGRLRQLADAAYDGEFTDEDLRHALGGTHVVVRERGLWLAHAAVVPRSILIGERRVRAGFVEAVAVRPGHQGLGLGTAVIEAINTVIAERYDIGALSTGDHEFYERLGWEEWHGPSWVIGADGVRRRTEDEDDGLMVLRCAATRDIDTTLSIACHDRPGDAW